MATHDKVIDGLNRLLADGTVFYQKLRHYHWNVTGQEFFTLHVKFEELYTAWSLTLDQLAERILMLEGTPLHTLAAVLDRARLEEDALVPTAMEMVDTLVADLHRLRSYAGDIISAAEEVGDRGTVNLLDGVCDVIEKDVWMLRAWKAETAKTWR